MRMLRQARQLHLAAVTRMLRPNATFACQLNAAQYIVSAGVSPQPFRKRLGTNTRDRAVVPAERRIGS